MLKDNKLKKGYFNNKKLIFEVKKSILNIMYGCKSCKTLTSDASATKEFYNILLRIQTIIILF